MAGLFNRVRNRQTGRRYLISTIKKDATTFETAVFAANFFYLPQGLRLKNPCLVKCCQDPEEANLLHKTLTQRLKVEYPGRVFQDYSAP
ncbi:hypothetical protein [Desulfobacca acetoxidans]|uniref:Uncharacterized protein n=1 Tax=Desulfobacca acetoxidans (strain ATCC 700848 / DSM 11109 / ASRB2) TaxID=880072 RepID=F2NE71_DESAR|nr:hypothetical protein [Desulfobacca acetoxidans]AEB10701.1 hypothetical protein Desac_2901 [Desulfobacca acetoxidans DSM 11109]